MAESSKRCSLLPARSRVDRALEQTARAKACVCAPQALQLIMDTMAVNHKLTGAGPSCGDPVLPCPKVCVSAAACCVPQVHHLASTQQHFVCV